MINTRLLELPLFEHLFKVPKVFEPLKFGRILVTGSQAVQENVASVLYKNKMLNSFENPDALNMAKDS